MFKSGVNSDSSLKLYWSVDYFDNSYAVYYMLIDNISLMGTSGNNNRFDGNFTTINQSINQSEVNTT